MITGTIQEFRITPVGDGILSVFDENNPPVVVRNFTGGSGYLTNRVGSPILLFEVTGSGCGEFVENPYLMLEGSSVVTIETDAFGVGSKFSLSAEQTATAVSVFTEFFGKKIGANGNSIEAIEVEIVGEGRTSKAGSETVFLLVQATSTGRKTTLAGSTTEISVETEATGFAIHWGNAIIFVPIDAVGEGEAIRPELVGRHLTSHIYQKTKLHSECKQKTFMESEITLGVVQWHNFY